MHIAGEEVLLSESGAKTDGSEASVQQLRK